METCLTLEEYYIVGTTKPISNIKSSVMTTSPSSIIGETPQLAVEIKNLEDGFNDCSICSNIYN